MPAVGGILQHNLPVAAKDCEFIDFTALGNIADKQICFIVNLQMRQNWEKSNISSELKAKRFFF